MSEHPPRCPVPPGSCFACQRLVRTRTHVVPPRIIRGAPILMIGAPPGWEEDRDGREPFIGTSGKELQQMCQEVGLDWQRISLANIVACRPTTQKLTSKGEPMFRRHTGDPILTDGDPTPEEVKNCSEFLESTIRRAKARIIVPVGKAALKRITGRSNIMSSNGMVMDNPKYPNTVIIPMLHLAGMRKEALFALGQIRKARDYELMPTAGNYRVVETIEGFHEMMAELRASDRFAFDIEASGLRDFQSVWIISMAFTTKKGTGWVLPWRLGTPEFYELVRADREAVNPKTGKPVRPTRISNVYEFAESHGMSDPGFKYYWKEYPEVHKQLDELFQSNRIKILHNAPYDIKVCQNKVPYQGFTFKGPIRDTMYMYFLQQGMRTKQSLEELTPRFTDLGNHKQVVRDWIKHDGSGDKPGDSYAIIPWEVISQYNAGDTDATYQIEEALIPQLEAMPSMIGRNMLGFLDMLMMPAQGLLVGAEEWGVNIDTVVLDKGGRELQIAIEKKRQELFRACSVAEFNTNSTPQLSDIFYNKLDLPVLKRTPKGVPSTDEETMKMLEQQESHPAPKILREYRKLVKLHGTYVEGLRNKLYADGRLHCNFNMTFTDTGRTSSTSPSLQVIPRPRKDEVVIKDFFIPTYDDWVFVAVDFGQAELRVSAWYAQDDVAIQMFKDGRDIHQEVAAFVFGLAPGVQESKEQRTIAKGINFGIIFGETGYGLADQLSIEAGRPTTPEEAQKWIDRVFEERPKLKKWMDLTKEYAHKYGRVLSATGRQNILPHINSNDEAMQREAERKATNMPVQSFSSDLLLLSVLRVDREIRRRGLSDKVKLWNLVHDQAVWEMPKDMYVMFLNEVALPNMTDWITQLFGFPFTADAEVGRPWGSMKHYCLECFGLSVEEKCPRCTVVTA